MNDSLSIWSAYREEQYKNRLRDYYLDLRNAAQREIAQNGSCKLLDQILPQIYLQDNITIIALRDAIEASFSDRVLPQNNVRFYSPQKGHGCLWEELNTRITIDKGRADQSWMAYSELKKRFCDLKQSLLNEEDEQVNKNCCDTQNQEPCNSNKTEEVKVQASDEADSQNIMTAAKSEAQKIIDEANARAQRIIEEAMQQAQSTIIEAEHKGDEVIEKAKNDAERIAQES